MIDCGQCSEGQICGEEVANECSNVEIESDDLWCDPNGGTFSPCSINSDCNEGLSCLEGSCYLECEEDDACGPGAFCGVSFGVAQCYKTCTSDGDCCAGSGMVCADLSDSFPGLPAICLF